MKESNLWMQKCLWIGLFIVIAIKYTFCLFQKKKLVIILSPFMSINSYLRIFFNYIPNAFICNSNKKTIKICRKTNSICKIKNKMCKRNRQKVVVQMTLLLSSTRRIKFRFDWSLLKLLVWIWWFNIILLL